MDGTVQNALSPEEKPIIENIISLFQQLLSMQDAGAQADPAVVEEAMGKEAEMDEIDVNKSTDGETGSDPAEKRIDEVTPTTDQSLQDLNKSIQSLTNLLNPPKAAAKTDVRALLQKALAVEPAKKQDPVLKALGEMTKVIKGISEKQNVQDQFNTMLMESIGYTDEVINKALPKDEPAKKDKPIQNIDTAAVVKDIMNEVFKNIPGLTQNQAQMHPFNEKTAVNKDLQSIASFVHHGAQRATRS